MPRSHASLLIAAGAVLLAAAPAAAQRRAPEVYGEFDGDPMYTVLPPDAIPAIRAPKFVSGAEADAQMAPGEHVIGIVRNGHARAYSTWQLDSHEIVNDRMQGAAIAVTW